MTRNNEFIQVSYRAAYWTKAV